MAILPTGYASPKDILDWMWMLNYDLQAANTIQHYNIIPISDETYPNKPSDVGCHGGEISLDFNDCDIKPGDESTPIVELLTDNTMSTSEITDISLFEELNFA